MIMQLEQVSFCQPLNLCLFLAEANKKGHGFSLDEK